MITDIQRKLIKDIEDAAINTMPVFAKLDYIEPMIAALEAEFARLNARAAELEARDDSDKRYDHEVKTVIYTSTTPPPKTYLEGEQ